GPRFYRSDKSSMSPIVPSGVDSPAETTAGIGLAARITDANLLEGLRLVTMPMGVAEVVTIYGSFYGGDVFSPRANEATADIASSMLDQGTKKRDKFTLSELLESVGARISFNSDDYRVTFSARCLRDDVPLVVELLAEQLREPAFNKRDLVSLQKRLVGNLKRQSETTDFWARLKFSQLVYPHDHPNYIPPLDKQIADIESISPSGLRAFHQRLYGLGNLIIVATGDVDRAVLEKSLEQCFGDWQKVDLAPPSLDGRRGYRDLAPREEVVTMKDKYSVDLIQGLAVGIDREHFDYLPLSMGTFILGGNFSARLMAAVRDEEGLTYGIGSAVGGASDGKDGYWSIYGTFAPNLLKKGKASVYKQLGKWVEKGVTTEELSVKKTTLIGNYKVSLVTTSGMASTILDILERGKEITYIDEYVEEINALKLEEVNAAVQKYIKPKNLITVAAGSIDRNWKSLTTE
ncbi:MAG: M16 family metallopeptidase, partial [Candidatus Neomarinimicrobiota bacterium]